jgi:Zn-finger nucleic acid-binding protein
MIVVEYSNVELDYCLNCHGVWFDSDELELLLKSMNLDTHDLLIDVCTHKDGLWFDGGEIAQLVKELAKKKPAGQESQHKVINFLGEVFKATA